MTREEIIHLEDTFQIPTYKKKPIVAARGEGADRRLADERRA